MADKHCPLYREPCHEHTCRWYIQLLGNNPQTGGPLPNDGWGCAVEYLPVLLIENAKETRHGAAAIESARNEARRDAVAISRGLLGAAFSRTEAVPCGDGFCESSPGSPSQARCSVCKKLAVEHLHHRHAPMVNPMGLLTRLVHRLGFKG